MSTDDELDSSRWPTVRLMDGESVVAKCIRVPALDDRPQRWQVTGNFISRAQDRYQFERGRRLDGLPYEERHAIFERTDHAHRNVPTTVTVQLIGDVLLEDAYRRDWDNVALEDIPGYREVYQLPGRTLRAERLHPILDKLVEAGVHRVQVTSLRVALD